MKISPKILLVEDNEDDLFFTKRALSKAGITDIFHVEHGRLALDYLGGRGPFADRGAYPLPHLVWVDLKIPVVSGHEVLEWIQTQPALSDLKVYVLSSSGEERDRLRAESAGAAGYLIKPLLVEDVEKILSRHEIPSHPR